jgi:hypothetical protein
LYARHGDRIGYCKESGPTTPGRCNCMKQDIKQALAEAELKQIGA